MSTPLTILGGLTAEQFLSEYWQKKPLLVKNALPEIANLFIPEEIQDLALEGASARLLTQHGDDWKVKSSPLDEEDFENLPELWTLLVQAVDHHSVDLADFWKEFDFLPQWRRDDIMVSYAPKGGSVGKHFDFYDVFLVQGYGQRRWQLGQTCDEHTAFVPDQPLKLLQEMDVHFDEVLEPGDLLYVPPKLSHYGVAQNDCLTFSFGFRMPNSAEMLDRLGDKFADNLVRKNPLIDIARQLPQPAGEITRQELDYLKAELLERLQNCSEFDDALMTLMSEPKYPDNVPAPDAIEDIADLKAVFEHNYLLQVEPASRLLYQHNKFWGNGEQICVSESSINMLKRLANGESIIFNAEHFDDDCLLQDLIQLLNDSILMILPSETEEDHS
ncbi:ribosomal protein uL16 3-hydroxylase [Acinetobacter sp. HY1485]|uniref:ribosomal protein uL16 3-hydroxylase n=1 Tax=Acinetobacter sp. HY1485 TaxID=2970918 RepID=UPI0022B990D6|nr:cupin domain-containing protein [Acinetobacter sp. HY1485]